MSQHTNERSVELLAPEREGLYSSQLHDWIPLCPQLSDSAVRLYWIMRSLVIEKYGPVRKLTLTELRHLLPAKPAVNGQPIKPSSHSRIRTLLRMLSDVGLVSTPEGGRLTTSSRAKAALGPLRIRINDRPRQDYEGPRNAFAALDDIRPAARAAAQHAAEREQHSAGCAASGPASLGSSGAGQAGQISDPVGLESNPPGQISDSISGGDLRERGLPLSPTVQSSRSASTRGGRSAEGAPCVPVARAEQAGSPLGGTAPALDALRAEGHTTPPPLCTKLTLRAPQTTALLAEVVGEVSAYQQDRLDRLVNGLLVDGEDDAMIAVRLRQRLAPLATGDPRRPYVFRRDGLSWALTVGLPYTPGGMTPMPCSNSWCSSLVRARATDHVRCDSCELQELEYDRDGLPAHEQGGPASADEPCPNELARVLEHLAIPSPALEHTTGDSDLLAGVPQPVREHITALTELSPAAGQAAMKAATAMYGQGPEGESEMACSRRVSHGARVLHAVTDHFQQELAAHYAGSRP